MSQADYRNRIRERQGAPVINPSFVAGQPARLTLPQSADPPPSRSINPVPPSAPLVSGMGTPEPQPVPQPEPQIDPQDSVPVPQISTQMPTFEGTRPEATPVAQDELPQPTIDPSTDEGAAVDYEEGKRDDVD